MSSMAQRNDDEDVRYEVFGFNMQLGFFAFSRVSYTDANGRAKTFTSMSLSDPGIGGHLVSGSTQSLPNTGPGGSVTYGVGEASVDADGNVSFSATAENENLITKVNSDGTIETGIELSAKKVVTGAVKVAAKGWSKLTGKKLSKAENFDLGVSAGFTFGDHQGGTQDDLDAYASEFDEVTDFSYDVAVSSTANENDDTPPQDTTQQFVRTNVDLFWQPDPAHTTERYGDAPPDPDDVDPVDYGLPSRNASPGAYGYGDGPDRLLAERIAQAHPPQPGQPTGNPLVDGPVLNPNPGGQPPAQPAEQPPAGGQQPGSSDDGYPSAPQPPASSDDGYPSAPGADDATDGGDADGTPSNGRSTSQGGPSRDDVRNNPGAFSPPTSTPPTSTPAPSTPAPTGQDGGSDNGGRAPAGGGTPSGGTPSGGTPSGGTPTGGTPGGSTHPGRPGGESGERGGSVDGTGRTHSNVSPGHPSGLNDGDEGNEGDEGDENNEELRLAA